MLIKILFLVYLHFIADFVFQNDFQANFKGTNDYILFVHSFIWAGTISLGLSFLGVFALWKFLMLLVGHFIIDRWKARKKDKTYSLTKDLWIDQGLHVAQIGICLIL